MNEKVNINIETINRSCPTCEACCGLTLEVDRKNKRVLSIKGNPDDHRSRGYVCAKSQAFNYVYEDSQRLRKPVKKTEHGWQEIGWQEAFEFAGEKLKSIREAHGKDAIAVYYGNPNGHNAATLLYTTLFGMMLDTERFFSAGTVDQQPKNVSSQLLFGEQWFFPIPDLDHTDFFICMGANPVVSQGSLMSAPNVEERIRSLQARGGKAVVIDPRVTETARLCDQHIFIKPGTDAFFLFAMIHVLFSEDRICLGHLQSFTHGLDRLRELSAAFSPEVVEGITGVSATVTRTLVAQYCAAETAVLYGRIGLCTQRFGTLASWLVDIVNILTGNFDKRGGAMFPRQATGQNEAADKVGELMYNRFQSRGNGFPEVGGQLPASLMAQELECEGDAAVLAMISLAGNPVISVPNGKRLRESMKKLEFYLAIDIYINETTSQADLILPPVSQLEHSNYDFLFAGTSIRNFASYSPKVFEPDADGLEQWQIMLSLLATMFDTSLESLDDMLTDGLIDSILSYIQEENPEASKESVAKAIGEHRGFERLLDAMLRAGPYGDKFTQKEGLSLAKLKESSASIDLGPLQPMLPQMLRTRDKQLHLVPEHIINDMPRLMQCFDDHVVSAKNDSLQNSHFLLIGRRHIRDMNSWLHNIKQYVRGKVRCELIMNSHDAGERGISNGDEVRLTSKVGDILVPVSLSADIMPGVVSLPHGWGHQYSDSQIDTAKREQPGVSCNDIIDDMDLDMPSGTSIVNGVEVEISLVR